MFFFVFLKCSIAFLQTLNDLSLESEASNDRGELDECRAPTCKLPQPHHATVEKKKEAEEKTEMFEKSLQTMESSKTKKKNDAEIAGVITLILDKIHYCTARLHITFQQVLTTLKNFI